MTLQAEARVATGNASRYIAQLCKHFAHKIEVSYDEARGHATFPYGSCVMDAQADGLFLRCVAEVREDLERIMGVVGGHLERFAWREELTVQWEMA
jgi:hypothetical protein